MVNDKIRAQSLRKEAKVDNPKKAQRNSGNAGYIASPNSVGLLSCFNTALQNKHLQLADCTIVRRWS